MASLLPTRWEAAEHVVLAAVPAPARHLPTHARPGSNRRWFTWVLPAAAPLRRRIAGRMVAVSASPGLRVLDPSDPTTALHQHYHDGNIQFTMENLQWVERKGYTETGMTPEQEAAVRAAARERLARWPRLQPQDTCRVSFGSGPRRFRGAVGDPMDNVFVVSLPRRPQKLAHALQQLKKHRLQATVVTAVDGDALESQADLEALGVRIMPEYQGHSNHDMPFTTGEVGCFLSHYTIWHRMLQEQIPSALILEDDFDLQEDFVQRLGECLLEAQGTPWNLLYVGRSPMENDVRCISEHVVQPGYTLWTVGYILRLEAARLLLETHAEQHMVPLDDFFSVAMGCGRDCQYNERTLEWSQHIPPVLVGLGLNPPLVMPYVGSLFFSDTAMLRKRTRYVQDLPLSVENRLQPSEPCTGRCTANSADRAGAGAMPAAWRAALEKVEALQAELLAAIQK